eukprot:CAMPEP_0175091998 /NCGR_PEP_ID=MMETSP0086_2-20121207/2218_1 /TAXON_ID=136419 /ORGANISM="Unknown Unknown, Strain D1" /LENGTH=272 /DNA_ID=CAMNT_0016364811 /DNA_START=59 /DNA_END=874 /DNA_ORIENTATION=-
MALSSPRQDTLDSYMQAQNSAGKKMKCPTCGSWPNSMGICTLCAKNHKRRARQLRDPNKPNVYIPPVLSDLEHEEKTRRIKCENCGAWRKQGSECGHCTRFRSKAGIRRRASSHNIPNVYQPPEAIDVAKTERGKRVKCIECGSWRFEGSACKLCTRVSARRPVKNHDSPGVYVPPVATDMATHDLLNQRKPRVKCGRCGSWEKNGVCVLCKKRDVIIARERASVNTMYVPPKAIDMKELDGDRQRVKCENCGIWRRVNAECRRCGPRTGIV